MRFAVSARGDVTAKTLCRFDKVVVPESALVGQSARVSTDCLVRLLLRLNQTDMRVEKREFA